MILKIRWRDQIDKFRWRWRRETLCTDILYVILPDPVKHTVIGVYGTGCRWRVWCVWPQTCKSEVASSATSDHQYLHLQFCAQVANSSIIVNSTYSSIV